MKLKLTFNSLDCIAIVKELQSIVGSRINQIYDVDTKTYLFKLNKPNSEKIVLLMESGIRIHLTKCDWPKNPAPSGFTMKLRKHISNKRISYLRQLGSDRVIDIQFGSGEVAFHIILELYSRGNIILADHNFTIVSLLRPFVDGDSFNYSVHQIYPINSAKTKTMVTANDICETFSSSKNNLSIKRALLPIVDLGSSLLEHAIIKAGFDPEKKSKSFNKEEIKIISEELSIAVEFLKEFSKKGDEGYIILEKGMDEVNAPCHMFEFNPCLFIQHQNYNHKHFETFNEAIDEYFSKLGNQKMEIKLFEQEKEAMNKVNKIRDDQSSRLEELSAKQLYDKKKADVIMSNASIVDEAIQILRSAIASQMPWMSIKDLVDEASRCNDPVASLISAVKLQINQISMKLSDPFNELDEEKVEVNLDLSLSAYANAKRYYDDKKHAALKERKTLESQKKALKSAEKKARETIKTIKTQATISKTRKPFWFEKFYWFISSENYLIIGGRDQKQNEVLVKRYLKSGDLYVHADIHGASSVIIKNISAKPVPPRTLDEAGLLAVCFSPAWSTQIVFNAWWVYHHQVSKTAPTGEYLVTGSFMIRGQKNYLIEQHLQLGFSLLFKVDDSSIHRHLHERKVKNYEDEFLESTNGSEISIDGNFPDNSADKHECLENFSIDSGTKSMKSSLNNCSTLSESLSEIQVLDVEKDEAQNNTSADAYDRENSDDNVCNENSEDEISNKPIITGALEKKQPDHGINKPLPIDECQNHIKNIEESSIDVDDSEESHSFNSITNNKYKRGQKSRQKKIKEKYRDQDEEDKKLRMSILKSAGTPKIVEKKNRKSKKLNKNPAPSDIKKKVVAVLQEPKENLFLASDKSNDFLQKSKLDEEDETTTESNELDMLNSLTGQPTEEDEILFALPIVAPYTSVLNNKFKVKMVPGFTKRGKAGRSAIEMFLRSKECSNREKDVIKGINDQMISRNFPGKVKIVVPQSKKK